MKSNQYYANHRPEMLGFLPDKYNNVLEVGCGKGLFFKSIKKPEGVSWGCEPNIESAEVAKSLFDRVVVGNYKDVCDQFPDNFFDLIICNDVIEHMVDYNYFFSNVKTKMTNSGYIIGSVPNFRYINNLREILIEKDWKYKESGILDETHLRFFTKKSLIRVLLSHRYKIIDIRGINKTTYVRNINSIIKRTASLVLGGDSEYFQIGFCAKK